MFARLRCQRERAELLSSIYSRAPVSNPSAHHTLRDPVANGNTHKYDLLSTLAFPWATGVRTIRVGVVHIINIPHLSHIPGTLLAIPSHPNAVPV